MAGDDDEWKVVEPPKSRVEERRDMPSQAAPSSNSEWADVIPPSGAAPGTSGTGKIPGSPQYEEDIKLVGEPSTAGGLEIFGTNAANTALFNIPSHVITGVKRGMEKVTPEEREAMGSVADRFQQQARREAPGTQRRFDKMVENIPSVAEDYYRDYAAQKEREAALQRQHPYYGGAGTATGFVAGLAVPMGPLATPGRLAARGIESLAAGSLAPAAVKTLGRIGEASVTGATVSGVSSLIEEPDINRALVSAGVGAVAGPLLSAATNKLVGHFAKNPEPLLPNGQWKPEAQKAIDEVFGPSIMSGKLDPADLATFKDNLAQNFRDKGISAAAARESGLKAAGVENPLASQTTGRAPTSGVMQEPEIVEAAQKAKDDIIQRLTQDIPAVPTHPDVAAQELYKAAKSAKEAVGKSYEALTAEPGRFTLGTNAKTLSTNMPSAIDAELSRSGYPIGEKLGAVPQYGTAKEAYKMVQKTIGEGNMPLGDELTMSNINEVRKGINNLWKSAPSGSADRNAIDAIRRGFDNSLIEAAQAGLFTGNAGQAIALLKQSTDLHSKFMKTFASGATGEDKIIRAAVGAFRDATGKLNPQSVDASAQVAQGILNSSLINNTLGPKVYNKLEATLGKNTPAMEAIRDNIRGSIFNTGGDIKNLSANIDRFLDPKNRLLAQKLFSPPEMSRLRLTSQALNDVMRNPKSDKSLNDEIAETIVRYMPSSLVSAGAGAIGYLTGGAGGALFGVAAAQAKHMGEKYGENIARSRQTKRELSGAPSMPTPYRGPFIPRTDIPAVPLAPPDKETGYAPSRPFVIGRATGGRVTNPESIANNLVSMADRAKKTINNDTEALLNTPDTHVAQALEIANRQIEG